MNAEQAKFLARVIGQNLQGEWMHTYKAINAIPTARRTTSPSRELALGMGTGASHRHLRRRLPAGGGQTNSFA